MIHAKPKKQFTNKKSGKVVSARAKLKDRFAQQDFLSQRKIIKAFLFGVKAKASASRAEMGMIVHAEE